MNLVTKSTLFALCLTLFSTAAMACSNDKCAQDSKGDKKMHLIRKAIAAVSQTGLTTEQASAVTDAVNALKMKRMEMKASKAFPIDAFKNDAFDAKAFKAAKQKHFDAKIDAVTAFFTEIYAILTPEQRPLFKRAFTAPMVEKMIKKNMVKGHMMGDFKPKGGCSGGSCR